MAVYPYGGQLTGRNNSLPTIYRYIFIDKMRSIFFKIIVGSRLNVQLSIILKVKYIEMTLKSWNGDFYLVCLDVFTVHVYMCVYSIYICFLSTSKLTH